VDHAKTVGGIRSITIPKFLADELAAHLAAHPEIGDDDLLFTAPAGGPLSRTLFRSAGYENLFARAKSLYGEITGELDRFQPSTCGRS